MANIGYIQVTRKCNQACLFCSNPPIDKESNLDEVKNIIDQFITQGYSEVIFTGGEPTLIPWLIDAIKYAKGKGIKPRIITNGSMTKNYSYLLSLIKGGLNHLHLSIYSPFPEIQNRVTSSPHSFNNIILTLKNIEKLYPNISCDINCTINALNSTHLDLLVKFITERFPFVRHFVFNGLDASSTRCKVNRFIIPKLKELELSLYKAVKLMKEKGITFRIERIPLCYMVGFEEASTETRKIIKDEHRTVFFLDSREVVFQKRDSFRYNYYEQCSICSLKEICAGLFFHNLEDDISSLYPRFIDPKRIIERVRRGNQ